MLLPLRRAYIFNSLFFLILFSMVSTAGAVAPDAMKLVTLNPAPINNIGQYSAPVTVPVKEGWLSLYPNLKGRVAVRKAGADIHLEAEDVPFAKYPMLIRDEKGIYAVWWRKQGRGEKSLLFSASYDEGQHFSPAHKINNKGGVLARYDLISDGKGRLAMAYLDERVTSYRIYFNRSTDYGRTWLKEDLRIDDEGEAKSFQPNEPQLAFIGERLIATWKDFRKPEGGGVGRLLARASADGGVSWGKIVVMSQGKGVISDDVLLTHGEYVYHFGQLLGIGIIVHRTQDGEQWTYLGALPGSDKTSNSQIQVATSGERLVVAYTGNEPGEKFRVLGGAFSTAAAKWLGEATRLDTGATTQTRAMSPYLLSLSDGAVLAAWQDYRNLLPNIYTNLTVDGGDSWLQEAQTYEFPGKNSSVYPNLLLSKGEVWMTFFHYVAGRSEQLKHEIMKLPAQRRWQLPGVSWGLLNKERREERLSQRVNEFWEHRIQKRYAKSRDYFDPGYQSLRGTAEQEGNSNAILYYEAELMKFEIEGNFAKVTVNYSASVPETMVGGKRFSMKKRDDTVDSTWLWIGDNWYKLYKPAGKRGILPY